MATVNYCISPTITDKELNTLCASAWPDHTAKEYLPVLHHSLLYVCAYDGDTLVGFVNVAWDGGVHAFILDTCVHKQWQRRGIGQKLVEVAAKEARARDIAWLHVDYAPHLQSFYAGCGFVHTAAGLMNLREEAFNYV